MDANVYGKVLVNMLVNMLVNTLVSVVHLVGIRTNTSK